MIEITAKITKNGQLEIPKKMKNLKEFKPGSKIQILAFKNNTELRSFEKMHEKNICALASEKSLAEYWNSEEDELAWKDL